MEEQYTVGVDFGTLSARAVVARCSDGHIMGSSEFQYPHAVMQQTLACSGEALPVDWALQDPNDYVAALQHAVPAAVAAACVAPGQIIAIGTDFTACTVLPVTADGVPLCNLEEFARRPHAYAKLWKHHAAQPQADRINAAARTRCEAWLQRYGGQISCEWELAKGLQILEEDPEIYGRMSKLVEAADWIVWQLCGSYVRNACSAGYKGNLQDGAYPSQHFLASVNPAFADFAETKLKHSIGQLGDRAGGLTRQAAAWTGLLEGTVVAVGNVDAHVTAPAARVTRPGQMLAIMGTSTCHIMSSSALVHVPGCCGVVDGGVVSGLFGYEAGQSGVGDVFAWYVENQVPSRYFEAAAAAGVSIHQHLSQLSAEECVGAHGLVALDWHSGNRSILCDHELSGAVIGLTLSTKPEQVYRALMEGTALYVRCDAALAMRQCVTCDTLCIGTRVILEAFRDAGVAVEQLVVAGGLVKNSILMQIYSDVTRLPLSLIACNYAPALGSCIHAAAAAAAYPSVAAAADCMGGTHRDVYQPNHARALEYDALFAEYRALHDHFGRQEQVMRRLKGMRRKGCAKEMKAGAASSAQ